MIMKDTDYDWRPIPINKLFRLEMQVHKVSQYFIVSTLL